MYIICIYLLIWLYMYKSMSSNWDFDGFHMISWDVQSTLAWSCEGIYPQGILVAGFQALTPAITFSIQASKNHKSRVCWGILHVGGEGLCIYKLYINYIYIHYYVSIYYIIYIYIVNRFATLDFSNQDRYHGQSWRIRANHGHGF